MSAKLLSPRDLSDAFGVSESTIKRWVDAGRIPAARTKGGHRRVTLDDAQAFVRAEGIHPRRPDLLGLATAEGGPGLPAASGDGTGGAPEPMPRAAPEAPRFD